MHHEATRQIPKDKLPSLWAKWSGGYARLIGRIGIEDSNAKLQSQSFSAFSEALQTVNCEFESNLCLLLYREYGKVCHECQYWEFSLEINRKAADIGMSLYNMAGTKLSKNTLLKDFLRTVHFAMYAAMQLNRAEEAVELAEIGRARWLTDTIRIASIRCSAATAKEKAAVDAVQANLLELERKELALEGAGAGEAIHGIQDFLNMPVGGDFKARIKSDPNALEARRCSDLELIRQGIRETRTELVQLIDAVSEKYDDILPDRLSCSQIQNLAKQADLTMIYVLATVWGATAVLLNETVEILDLPGIERPTVKNLLDGNEGYKNVLAGDDVEMFEASLARIEAVVTQHIINPIAAWAQDKGLDSLAVISLGDIGLLPLQVATVRARLKIRFLPSACILDLLLKQKVANIGQNQQLLTVGGVDSKNLAKLRFSRAESLAVKAVFNHAGIAVQSYLGSASFEDVDSLLAEISHLHLACHGSFSPSSPLNSRIHLTDEEVLPVESLLRPTLKLTGVELVILSACNSAQEEFWQTPDEAIGFPTVFLLAGAKQIVAAQWKVDDIATFLLMHKFCHELVDHPHDVAGSLVKAQRWLGAVTALEIAETIDNLLAIMGKGEQKTKRYLKHLSAFQASLGEVRPFAKRRYWAAFVCVGIS